MLSEQTSDQWRKDYRGVRTDQVRRLEDLEREDARPTRLVAEAERDEAIPREAAAGNV